MSHATDATTTPGQAPKRLSAFAQHKRALLQSASLYWTAPPSAVRVCVLEASPVVAAVVPNSIADGTVMSSTVAQQMLQGFGMEMMDVLFTQILKWNYTVSYYPYAWDELVYMIRKGVACDLGVQSFFISPSNGDVCSVPSACPELPPNWYSVPHNQTDYAPYMCCVDFSYPYFTGGWTFMSQVQTTGLTVNYISVFFQQLIVNTIAVCVIACFGMAHLIWLIERTQYGKSVLLTNPKEGFNPKYLDGLRDGMWFATNVLLNGIVNCEKTVITPFGRFMTTLWTLFGILIMAFITSILSSTLTTSNLSGSQILTAADVAGLDVCMEAGFISNFFVTSFPGVGVKKTLVVDVSQCYPKVTAGTVDVVFDVREQSITWLQSGHGSNLLISPVVLSQAYGMLMPEKWPYKSWLNEALLMWKEGESGGGINGNPTYAHSAATWFSGSPSEITWGDPADANTSQPYNYHLIYPALALVLMHMALQLFVGFGHYMKRRIDRQESGSSSGSSHAKHSVSQRLATMAQMLAEAPGAHSLDDKAEFNQSGFGSKSGDTAYQGSGRTRRGSGVVGISSSKVAPQPGLLKAEAGERESLDDEQGAIIKELQDEISDMMQQMAMICSALVPLPASSAPAPAPAPPAAEMSTPAPDPNPSAKEASAPAPTPAPLMQASPRRVPSPAPPPPRTPTVPSLSPRAAQLAEPSSAASLLNPPLLEAL